MNEIAKKITFSVLCCLSIGLTSWYIIETTVNDNKIKVITTTLDSSASQPVANHYTEFTPIPSVKPTRKFTPTTIIRRPTEEPVSTPSSNTQPSQKPGATQPRVVTSTKTTPPPVKTTVKVTPPPPTKVSTPTPKPPTPSPTLPPSRYKDGSYSASGSYVTHGGEQQMGVAMTIKNDIVTSVTITPMADDSRSLQDQQRLASEIGKYVVGYPPDHALQVGVINGASDTTDGFKNAVNQIINQALR